MWIKYTPLGVRSRGLGVRSTVRTLHPCAGVWYGVPLIASYGSGLYWVQKLMMLRVLGGHPLERPYDVVVRAMGWHHDLSMYGHAERDPQPQVRHGTTTRPSTQGPIPSYIRFSSYPVGPKCVLCPCRPSCARPYGTSGPSLCAYFSQLR